MAILQRLVSKEGGGVDEAGNKGQSHKTESCIGVLIDGELGDRTNQFTSKA